MILKIDPDLADLFGKLPEPYYGKLKEDIRENGINDPLIIAEDGTVVSGHNRFYIAQELGIDEDDIPTKVQHFDNKEEMFAYAIQNNRNRHELIPYRWCLIGLKYLEFEREAAKKRSGTRTDLMEKTSVNKFTKVRGRADDKVAEMVGTNRQYIYYVRKIEESPFEELKRMARAGDLTIHQAYRELRELQGGGESKTPFKPPRLRFSEVVLPVQNGAGDYIVAFNVPAECSRGVRVTLEPLEKESLIAEAREKHDAERMLAMVEDFENGTKRDMSEFEEALKRDLRG